jgi:mRNA-degrading endonuclease HigB of HigAB toxin-antitoxin module
VGKPDRYSETITFAYLFLIREKMASCAGNNWSNNWEEFAEKNPELLVWKDGLLERYYRPETLKSEFARNVFVLPDKSL